MRRCIFAVLALIVMIAGPVTGQDNKTGLRMAASLEARGITLSPEQRDQIAQELTAAEQVHPKPAIYPYSVEMANHMAELSQTATRPSARVRLEEMHRQLVASLMPGQSLALQLLEQKNPTIHYIEPGVGMTERDVGWNMMFEVMRHDLPDDPGDVQIDPDVATGLMAKVNRSFVTDGASAKYFLSHLDSWAFGTIAAWQQLSPAQRQVAVNVVGEPGIPAPDVLSAVIGTTDINLWMTGQDIGLTEDEKAAYPNLTKFLADGYMVGGYAELLPKPPAGAAMFGNAATVMMMQELNYDLLFGNDFSTFD